MSRKRKTDTEVYYNESIDYDIEISELNFEDAIRKFHELCLKYKTTEEAEIIINDIKQKREKSINRLKTYRVDESLFSAGIEVITDFYKDRFESVDLYFREHRSLSAPLTQKELDAEVERKKKNRARTKKRKATRIKKLKEELKKLEGND